MKARGPTLDGRTGQARPRLQGGWDRHGGQLIAYERRSRRLILATDAGLATHGLTPMARIVSSAAAGVHPDAMGIGPVPASEKAMKRAGIGPDDVDLVEINEAFASQTVASIRLLEIDQERVNVNGGAIAIGHPLGASGARILTTLTHELVRRGGRYGLATMCIGVGQGISTVIERV